MDKNYTSINERAAFVVKTKGGQDFKKSVLEALKPDTAHPHVVIWWDFKIGWCVAVGSGMNDSDVVKQGIAWRIEEIIKENDLTKFFKGLKI